MQLYCLHLKLDHGTEWKKTPADTLAVTEKDEQTIISSLAGISKEICLVLLYLHVPYNCANFARRGNRISFHLP